MENVREEEDVACLVRTGDSLIHNLHRGSQANHEKPQQGQPRFEVGTSRIRNRCPVLNYLNYEGVSTSFRTESITK